MSKEDDDQVWTDETRDTFVAHLTKIMRQASESLDAETMMDARRTLCMLALVRQGYGIDEYEAAIVVNQQMPSAGAH